MGNARLRLGHIIKRTNSASFDSASGQGYVVSVSRILFQITHGECKHMNSITPNPFSQNNRLIYLYTAVKLCMALFLTGARLLSCQCPVLKQFTESLFLRM